MRSLRLVAPIVAVSAVPLVDAFVITQPQQQQATLQRKHQLSTAIRDDDDTTTIDVGVRLAEQVHPSVALVTPMGVRNMKTRGSGFVVDFEENELLVEDYNTDNYTYLVTAAHVAAPGFGISVTFPGSNKDAPIPATVLGRNKTLDLALLRMDLNDGKLSCLSIATELPQTGTAAFAHGYPASRLRGPAMTSGIVCGIADGLGVPDDDNDDESTRRFRGGGGGWFGNVNDTTTFVVTDAAMSGGMSGGPLTDAKGNVLGVNALIRPDLRALGNYAVSAKEVLSFLNDMKQSATTLEETKKDQQYQVLLFNDPMNKKQRVADVLEGVASMNGQDANKVMMEAHTTGQGVIKSFGDRADADELCLALRKEDLLVEVQ